MKNNIELLIINHKFKIIGATLGIFTFVCIILPMTLDKLFNHSNNFFETWSDIGISCFSFVFLILIGIVIGHIWDEN